jgi:hypothetical protein
MVLATTRVAMNPNPFRLGTRLFSIVESPFQLIFGEEEENEEE